MNTWTMRAYGAPNDGEALLALVSRREAERVADYPGLLDLEELLELESVRQGTAIWLDAQGQMAAFAMLDGERLDFEIAPGEPGWEPGSEILAWAVQKRRGERAGIEENLLLSTGCRDDNHARLKLLETLSFTPEPVRTHHFRRDLNQPIPAPRLPAGFVIRPVTGEGEVQAHVALHRAAFGTEEMTVEMRLAMMRTAGYEAALDLVAVAPNGDLAAYVMCHINPRENDLRGMRVGYTDPVATHPAYQRLGLARALLLTGLRLLKERGMAYAEMGTYGENTGMIQTAISAGYAQYGSTIFFTREIANV